MEREYGDLVGAAEMQAMLSVGRTRMKQLADRPDFPPPVADLEMGRVWRTADVREWAARHGREIAE